MKKILLLTLGLVVALMSVSCSGMKNDSSLGKGKIMSLKFETNPGTGFYWEYKFENGDAEIELDREESISNNNFDIVGGPNDVVYYFRAKKSGNTNLVFTYRRPWEGGEVAYDVVYELQVDENLNITCLSKMKGVVQSDEELSFFPNPIFS